MTDDAPPLYGTGSGTDPASMTMPELQGAQELALSHIGDDVRGEAQRYLRPHLRAFLERVAKEATQGGRRSEASTKLFADIMGLREKIQILNLFIDRLGVDESQARAAVELKRRLDTLDEHQIAEMVARSLAQYVRRQPERQKRIIELLQFGLDSEAVNGGKSTT